MLNEHHKDKIIAVIEETLDFFDGPMTTMLDIRAFSENLRAMIPCLQVKRQIPILPPFTFLDGFVTSILGFYAFYEAKHASRRQYTKQFWASLQVLSGLFTLASGLLTVATIITASMIGAAATMGTFAISGIIFSLSCWVSFAESCYYLHHAHKKQNLYYLLDDRLKKTTHIYKKITALETQKTKEADPEKQKSLENEISTLADKHHRLFYQANMIYHYISDTEPLKNKANLTRIMRQVENTGVAEENYRSVLKNSRAQLTDITEAKKFRKHYVEQLLLKQKYHASEEKRNVVMFGMGVVALSLFAITPFIPTIPLLLSAVIVLSSAIAAVTGLYTLYKKYHVEPKKENKNIQREIKILIQEDKKNTPQDAFSDVSKEKIPHTIADGKRILSTFERQCAYEVFINKTEKNLASDPKKFEEELKKMDEKTFKALIKPVMRNKACNSLLLKKFGLSADLQHRVLKNDEKNILSTLSHEDKRHIIRHSLVHAP
jgi:hypothetical protein